MAIGTDAAVVFEGSEHTAISDTSAISAGLFNADTPTAMTASEHLGAPNAVAKLSVALATAGVAGEFFTLFRVRSGGQTPDAAFPHEEVGVFPIDNGAGTGAQVIFADIRLVPGSQSFYLRNNTTYATTGTTVVTITPNTIGPKT